MEDEIQKIWNKLDDPDIWGICDTLGIAGVGALAVKNYKNIKEL